MKRILTSYISIRKKRITKTSKPMQNSTNSSKPDGKKADITIS